MFRNIFAFLVIIQLSLTGSLTGCGAPKAPTSVLWDFYPTLQSKEWVDLTHTFDLGIPHWKGIPEMTRKKLYTHKKDGFLIERYSFAGQWGTHVDPPMHFHEELRSQDKIEPKEMLLPLVVLDVHKEVAKNPDYTLKMSVIENWEKAHGPIPLSAFIAMRTDWSDRWPSQKAMQNVDKKKIAHYPGWSIEALQYLVEIRNAVGIGHETTDTDPGVATSKDDYSLESYVLGKDRYQIELLANLKEVPEYGALVSVTWPKVKNGSGFPARVFAILP